MQKSIIDRIVIKYQAQFASQDSISSKFSFVGKYNPCPGVPLRYRKR